MKLTKLLLAAVAAFALAACSDDDEPQIKTLTVTFEGAEWARYIDTPQNNGPLLYGDGSYAWTDAATTLSSELTNDYGDGMFWGGGIAISNYVDADLAHADADHQLAVPVANSSQNFAVVNTHATFYFKDQRPRFIYAIQIAPTTYLLGVMKNGNAFARALTSPTDFFRVKATGYVGSTKTATIDIPIAVNGTFLEGWGTGTLQGLGRVTSVEFTFEGSDTGDYGLNTPTYFAFDNVVVEDLPAGQ